MNIEVEKSLYAQALSWGSEAIPKEVKEYCRLKFPIVRVQLSSGLKIMRVESFGMAVPFLEEIKRLLNDTLPDSHPRFTIGQLTEETHRLQDGRTVDFKETWKGNTFLIEEQSKLAGVVISRKEKILKSDDTWRFTGRGFIPVVAAVEGFWGTKKISLLSLSLKSLVESGVTEIRGSCAKSNILADKLYSKIAIERWRDGDWIRYKIDPVVADWTFDFVVKRFDLSQTDIKKLVSPINV